MHTRIVKPKGGPTLLVRPLRRGDTDTVNAMFERLGQRSRRTRFNGPKPRLSAGDLEQLCSRRGPEPSRARGLCERSSPNTGVPVVG